MTAAYRLQVGLSWFVGFEKPKWVPHRHSDHDDDLFGVIGSGGCLNLYVQKMDVLHKVVSARCRCGKDIDCDKFANLLVVGRPAPVNALIRLALPCQRHIVRVTPPQDAGLGLSGTPGRGDGIHLSV